MEACHSQTNWQWQSCFLSNHSCCPLSPEPFLDGNSSHLALHGCGRGDTGSRAHSGQALFPACSSPWWWKLSSNQNHCCCLPYPRWLPTYKLQSGYNPSQFFLMPQCPSLCCLSWSLAVSVLIQTMFSSPPSLQRKCSALPKFQPGLDNLILLSSSALKKVVIPAVTWPQTLFKVFQAGQGKACPAQRSLGWIAGVQKDSLRVCLTDAWVVPRSEASSSPCLAVGAGSWLGCTPAAWLCNTSVPVSYSSHSLMQAGGIPHM